MAIVDIVRTAVSELSLKEQHETQIIKSKMQNDPTSDQFKVSYPSTQNPTILPNNKLQVIEIAEREREREKNDL